MYDAKSEAHEFVGEDRGEAVAKACEFFGVEEDKLTVREPRDVYGLGGRAVVVALPVDARRPQRGGRDDDRGGDRDRGRDRDRGGRDRGRGRDREGGRGRDRDRGRSRGRDRDGDREVAVEEEDRGTARGFVESKGQAVGDVGETGEFVIGIVERMGLGDFELTSSGEGDFVVYELRGTAARALGSGDGRAVDGLQLLANQHAARQSDDPPRVVVDAEADPERREAFLTRLADRAARRARDSRRSVALDPMNPRDRRIVHVALREADAVATMSVGSGRYRQVVVVPEGSPEYDEARNASEAAESREQD